MSKQAAYFSKMMNDALPRVSSQRFVAFVRVIHRTKEKKLFFRKS
jgi:hypothetical protein